MTDFDNNYFDFENTDNFLETISGTLQSLSPSSISDESLKNTKTPENLSMDYINYNYMNPANNHPEDNQIFDQGQQAQQGSQGQPQQQQVQQAQQSGSISTYSNGISPISQPSVSSAHTSPTLPIKKEFTSEDQFDEDEDEEEEDNTAPTKKGKKSMNSKSVKPKKDKNSHNMIEKKYRTNINSKILALRDAVPSLKIATGSKDISVADLEGLTPASKLNKASVLTKATEYIKHLENKNNILKQQNYQLQTLINQANLQPQQMLHVDQMNNQQQLQQQHQQQQQQQPGFGFYPQENFNVTYNQQPVSYGNVPTNSVYNVPQTSGSSTNKILLGGMATVLGTSLFAGSGNDFKGLSGLPISFLLPKMLTNPSPLTIQLFELSKMLLFFVASATLIWPMFKSKFYSNPDSKQSPIVEAEDNILKSWVFVNIGMQLPTKTNDLETQQIVYRLIGGNPSTYQLIKDYMVLSSSSATFENCLLNLIIGKILIKKIPMISYVINNNLTIKGALILNMEYRGKNKSLIRLNKLIGKVDGLSFFGSDELFTRIINLSENKPINSNIYDGQNHLKYVDIFTSNHQDYFAILFNWRILEIIHQLNVTYLEFDDDEIKIIKNDLDIINEILDEDSNIYQYFNLFKTIVNFNNSPNLLRSFQKKIDMYLKNFDLITNGQELTDNEEISEDEDEYESLTFQTTNTTNRPIKSLITSLNLINQEEFIILTSSLVLYYYKINETNHAIKLLNYLSKLSKDTSISLLTFTSLINLIEVIPNIDDNENLDNLIIIIREWLNNKNLNNFMDFNTKSNLTKLVVNKGMALNGIEVNETDED